MTLYRTKGGVWEADFRPAGMKRLHLSLGRDADAAEEAYRAVQKLVKQKRGALLDQLRLPKGHPQKLTVERLVAMVDRHEPLVPIPAPAEAPAPAPEPAHYWGTVDDVVARYLAWVRAHPKKSAGTLKTAKAHITRFAEAVVPTGPRGAPQRLGDLPFDAVRSTHIAAYQSLILEQLAKSTVSLYMGRVGTLWHWAEEQEAWAAREERRAPVLLFNPVNPELLVREVGRRDRALTEDEAERMLAATPDPLLVVVAGGLFGGFRLGELLHMRTEEDVDLELGTLAVQKGRKDWKAKTRRSYRVVPITETFRPIVERHLARYASDRWLVPSARSLARPMPERTFQHNFEIIVRRAGLLPGRADPQGVTFHTLRHTFASWLVRRGVDLYTVAQLLGDTLQMVEDTYAHLSPDVKRLAVAKLDGAVRVPDLAVEDVEDAEDAAAEPAAPTEDATRELPQKGAA